MASNASEGAQAPPPLIGLSTYVDRARYGAWDEVAAILPYTYVRSVSRAGGCAVLLPPMPEGPEAAARSSAVLAALDGLIVSGGPDVDPRLYGALPHGKTDPPRQERDAWEIALCRGALEHDLPLLAICRGLQVLNVSLDGTLHQHLPDVLASNAHRAAPGQMTTNRIALDEGSAVASILGPETEGSCHHHQAIDQLGRRVQAVGFAADGTIEAVEVEGHDFAIGVQWHPEDDQDDDRLFVALVEAASRHRIGHPAELHPSLPGPSRL
ncbi:MAG: gamma-glutamyl-gamma-aminobutyrate hydrolase family protein [Acidimicrobiales bacterium]